MPDTSPKTSAFSKYFDDMSSEDKDSLIGTGTSVIGDIIGSSNAGRYQRSGAKGKAIGGGIGAGLGMAIGGPLGAAAGQALGSTVGSLIGGGADTRRMIGDDEHEQQTRNLRLNLDPNMNAYGQFEEGGVADPGPRSGRLRSLIDTPDHTAIKQPVFTPAKHDYGSSLSPSELATQRASQWMETAKKLNALRDNHTTMYNAIYNKAKQEGWNDARMHAELDRATGPLQAQITDMESQLPKHYKEGGIVTLEGIEPIGDMYTPMYKDGGSVHIKASHKGRFTAWAKSHGMSVGEAARHVMANKDKYGSHVVAMANFAKNFGHYEEGGSVDQDQDDSQQEQQQQPETKKINIEKGEILSDTEGKILQEFNNPNRFSPHADHQFKEPMGNFVDVDPSSVVIPKKLARTFKEGDEITRKSIMRKLVDQQVEDPSINDPKMEDGGIADPDDKPIVKPKLNAFDGIIVPTAAAHKSITDLSTTAPFTTVKDNSGTQKPKTDWRMIGRNLESKLPGLYQGIKASQGDPFLHPVYNEGYDSAKGYAMQLPDHINVDDQLQQVNDSEAVTAGAIRNANSPSGRAELSVSQAAGDKAKAGIEANKVREETGMRTNKLQSLMGIAANQGASDQAENVRVQNEQRMDKAARENTMAGVLDQNYRMDAGFSNDLDKIKALNHLSKFEDIDPFTMQKYTEDPEAVNYIYSYIERGGNVSNAISSYERYKTTTVQKSKQQTDARGAVKGRTNETITVQKPTK